jgi:hypothetical protein
VNTKNGLLGVFVILTIVFASSTLIEHGQVTTSTTTTTTIQTDTTTTTRTIIQSNVSTGSWMFLSVSGNCTGPCFGGDAYVFNCASAAATSQGCTTSTTGPYPSYVMNIKYPFANQTEPSWANCLWTVQGITQGQGYAYCISINSTSFIMGEQAPPHQ